MKSLQQEFETAIIYAPYIPLHICTTIDKELQEQIQKTRKEDILHKSEDEAGIGEVLDVL